jgi:hypothetical protein
MLQVEFCNYYSKLTASAFHIFLLQDDSLSWSQKTAMWCLECHVVFHVSTQEGNVDLYIHSSMRLQGAVLN